MRISPHQIPHDGREVMITLDEKWAREGVALGASSRVTALKGQLFLRSYDAQIRVTGHVQATMERECDRCTQDMEWTWGEEIDLSYLPVGSRDDGSRALAKDELDIGFYPVEGLDLGRVLEEFFALEAPGRLTCDASIARALAGEPCSLSALVAEPSKRPDSRFAALAGLKLPEQG